MKKMLEVAESLCHLFSLPLGSLLTCWALQENPKLDAAVESHPNVEKRDVRMGQPAFPQRPKRNETEFTVRQNSLLKKCFLGAAVPQRLEAAVDSAAVAARVELVPFPVYCRWDSC